MKKEILRLEQIYVPPYLSGLNMEIYSSEIVSLICLDYLGLDCLWGIIQRLFRKSACEFDCGRAFFCGEKVGESKSCQKFAGKIAVVSKADVLVPSLRVAENLFVVRRGYRSFLIKRRTLNSQAKLVFAELGVEIAPSAYADTLPQCDRKILELVKAWVSGARLVVVRGISDFLSDDELGRFVRVMRLLADRGMAFLYVCNQHREAFRFSDRCFLMRQGKIAKRLSPLQMTEAMMSHYAYSFKNRAYGKESRRGFPAQKKIGGEAFFCKLYGVEFSIEDGETVVVIDRDARTIGSVFGVLSECRTRSPAQARVYGRPWNPLNRSVAMIPSEPAERFLFNQLSVLDNICFSLDSKIWDIWLNPKKRNVVAWDLLPVFGKDVFAASLDNIDCKLKHDIIYQRILLQHPMFVCAMQPFSSADQFTRIRLLEYFDKFRSMGITVCIMAYSISDCLEVADRLLVINDGKISHEYMRRDFGKYAGTSASYVK